MARDLSSEVTDGVEVVSVVLGDNGRFLLIKLSDLQLKLPVFILQGAHLHTQAEQQAQCQTARSFLFTISRCVCQRLFQTESGQQVTNIIPS